MRNLLNPKWLLLINTLPLTILFVLLFSDFNVIKSLLKAENIQLWITYGLLLGGMGFLNLIYAVYLILQKKQVSVIYGVIALLCYIPWLYLLACKVDDILPFTIPQWMLTGDIFISAGTFLMPTLAYALFILVIRLTPEKKQNKPWKDLAISFAIPTVWYMFIMLLIPFWKPVDSNFGIHVLVILFIVGTLVFIFFLTRAIYILVSQKAEIFQKNKLAWLIPISIVFPVMGLLVNNTFGNFMSNDHSGIIGNFSNLWFYILAVLNGTVICLPNRTNQLYRSFLFFARSLTFAYTLYFFLVFLPLLPISIIAILGIGTGFLMLMPLLLFVVHTSELSKDFKFLNDFYSKKMIWAISLAGFIIIPATITLSYLNDKKVLNETMDYLDSPDYSKSYNLNEASLRKTMDIVKMHKKGSSGFVIGVNIPYLTSYFNWLVFENMTVSDAKIRAIEKIFFNTDSLKMRVDPIQNNRAIVTSFNTKSTYDKAQKTWKSWVNLEIANDSIGIGEFETTIDLPEGCWISDYYLYVGKKKEMGLLAEKKSAMWVFSQIRNENRDPGILYYLTGNRVAFQIFPFALGETRKSGIEFLHKEPVRLNIDGHFIELGNTAQDSIGSFENKDVIYVTANQKKTLKSIHRKPYFHFLVDVSMKENIKKKEYTKRIEALCEKYKPLANNAMVSFVNSYVTTYPMDKSWEQKYESQEFKGGYYLDRAIKIALFNSFANGKETYPIIVAVTDSINNAVLNTDFSDFKMAFPESDLFYVLDRNVKLEPHSLVSKPNAKMIDTLSCTFNQSVLAFPMADHSIAFLPNNGKPSIILKKKQFNMDESSLKVKNWQSAMALQAKWISQIFYPQTSEKEWIQMIKGSFVTQVMNPATSYLVVENEAQKAALKRKQDLVLSSNKSLDLGEDTPRMSEPSLILLSLLLGLSLWLREKRKRVLKKH